MLGGYELIESLDLVGNAPRIAEEAVALHSAAQCPEGTSTIILGSSQLGLQIHESIGHPIELDRVLGLEANFAGMSFLTSKNCASCTTARTSSTSSPTRASSTVPASAPSPTTTKASPRNARRSSPTASSPATSAIAKPPSAIGEKRSGGTMRTESWNRLPMIRMTNISITPGTWKYDDLIADTDDAILMETNRSWSIDDRRYHFQFSTEIGWEIKGGKKGRMMKNPSYSGITTEFWNSCDAICSRDHWTLWGTPNCGKGQPMQTMGTGHGASPARFRNVRIGVAFAKQ